MVLLDFCKWIVPLDWGVCVCKKAEPLWKLNGVLGGSWCYFSTWIRWFLSWSNWYPKSQEPNLKCLDLEVQNDRSLVEAFFEKFVGSCPKKLQSTHKLRVQTHIRLLEMIFDIQLCCKLYNHQTHLRKPPRTPKSKLDTAVAKPVPSKGGCLATRIHCQAELLQRSCSPSGPIPFFVAIIFFPSSACSVLPSNSSHSHKKPYNLFLPYPKIFRGNPFFDITCLNAASRNLRGNPAVKRFGGHQCCVHKINWPGKTQIFFRICECFILIGHGNPSQYNIQLNSSII